MFRKFFEACTITLGLYFCLQSSSISISYENFLSFNASKFEQFSLSSVQEEIVSNGWWPWRNQEKFKPRVNQY